MNPVVLPKIIAHRGAPNYAAENTLASVRKAKELKATWIEFDVMLTKDGVPVVMHDRTVDRTTNGSGRVCDFTLARLSKLDAGDQQQVPTLTDWLKLAARLGLGINLEIKEKASRASEITQKIFDQIKKYWPASSPKPLISSARLACIKAYRKLDPHVDIAYIVPALPLRWKSRLQAVQACALVIDYKRVRKADIAKIHKAGYKVLAYTVNDYATYQKLLEKGIDGVFTNDLKIVREPGAVPLS